MSKLKVMIYGEPVLRKKALKVESFDEELRTLIDDMVDTMGDEDGVGLAANQVGVLKRVIVVNPVPGRGQTLMKIVNPEITWESDETENFEEGCLSVPGIRGKIVRPVAVRLDYQDENGEHRSIEADGLVARIVQHEIDHLDGVLCVDRLSRAKKSMIKGHLRELERMAGRE